MNGLEDRWLIVQALFAELLDVPADRREAHLMEQSRGDAILCDQVRRLLLAHDEASDTFLATADRTSLWPLADLAVDDTLGEQARRRLTKAASVDPLEGKRFGQFEVVGFLGAGGMGVVYEAVQAKPRRNVALKVMRPNMYSRSAMRRFAFEAELLGRLNHPGIAQIIDAGATDAGEGGQPYFAMELVNGPSLIHYVRDHDLATAERLRQFLKVCDAVQHAHQRGVVHRDLKPANILVVDGKNSPADAQPKILDFGIAGTIDVEVQLTTLRADLQSIVGTVAYMSPEQIRGELQSVDARSDVYALGVVLYELLTGTLPCDVKGKPLPEAMRIVSEVEPAAVESLDRRLRGDLSTIVRKAMEKDPSRRYPSVASLAEDISRFLRSEPIAARPPSVAYIVRRFVQRNRAFSAAGVAAALLLTFGVWAMNDARVRAIEAQGEAQQQYEEARRMSNFFLRDVVTRLSRVPGSIEVRRDIIEEVLRQTEGFLEARPHEPALLDDYARSLRAYAYLAPDDADRMRQQLQEIVAIRERLVEMDPENLDYWVELGESYTQYGDFIDTSDDHAQQLALNLNVLDIDRWLVEQNPHSRRFRDNLFWSFHRISRVHAWRGDRAAELQWAQQALAAAMELEQRFPVHYLTNYACSAAHHRMGAALLQSSRNDAAIPHLMQALDYAERLNRQYPHAWHFLRHTINAASDAVLAGREEGNDTLLLRAYSLMRDAARELQRAEPDTHAWRRRAEEAEQYLDELDVTVLD